MPVPTKRVHFDDDAPSPASSESSLASSSAGPFTPPQYAQYLPPSAKPYPAQSPLPFGTPKYVGGQVSIHPALAAPQMSGYAVAFQWDIILHPSSAHPSSAGSLLSPASAQSLLSEYATNPPLPELTVVCDMLPWAISVKPAEGAAWSPGARRLVTVGDVLHAVYRNTRLSVSESEVNYLQYEDQGRVNAAFHARYARLPDPYQRHDEKAKGVKRIDFLLDRRGFCGLVLVTGGAVMKGKRLGDVWALQLQAVP